MAQPRYALAPVGEGRRPEGGRRPGAKAQRLWAWLQVRNVALRSWHESLTMSGSGVGAFQGLAVRKARHRTLKDAARGDGEKRGAVRLGQGLRDGAAWVWRAKGAPRLPAGRRYLVGASATASRLR